MAAKEPRQSDRAIGRDKREVKSSTVAAVTDQYRIWRLGGGRETAVRFMNVCQTLTIIHKSRKLGLYSIVRQLFVTFQFIDFLNERMRGRKSSNLLLFIITRRKMFSLMLIYYTINVFS